MSVVVAVNAAANAPTSRQKLMLTQPNGYAALCKLRSTI